MTDLPPAVDVEPRNPYVRALWIAGAVLVLGGLAGSVSTTLIYQNGFSYSSDSIPVEVVVAQLIGSVAPGAFSGGLLCCALALMIGGLRFDRNRRSVQDDESEDTSPVEPVDMPVVRSEPALRSAPLGHRATSGVHSKPQAVDYTVFMRPEEPEPQSTPRP